MKPYPHGTLFWQCNICGEDCACNMSQLQREVPSCTACGATVRMRAIIHALSVALFGKSMVIKDFPATSLSGKGMSDWDGYAQPLSAKLNYCNTFYHQTPFLDISTINETDVASVDFLISSDVFEHVTPPISNAFLNAYNMLRDNGVFILSVPYTLNAETVEHFPDLCTYHVESINGEPVLINVDKNNIRTEYRNLTYHGGAGETLELRIFSKDNLLAELRGAGFSSIAIVDESVFQYGIHWQDKWSLPIIARR